MRKFSTVVLKTCCCTMIQLCQVHASIRSAKDIPESNAPTLEKKIKINFMSSVQNKYQMHISPS
jgi:hypothetical protein